MRKFILILAILLAAAAIWWYLTPAPLAPDHDAGPVAAAGDRDDTGTGASSSSPLPPSSPPVSPARATASPAPAGEEQPPASLDEEARGYIDDISDTELEPVPVQKADNFVRRDQIISLIPDESIETTTTAKLLADPKVKPGTPITVVRTTEQIEVTTPENIIRQAGGSLDRTIRVLENDDVRETTVGELLETYKDNPRQPISIVKKERHLEILTARELEEENAASSDAPIHVIRQPYGLESTTVGELLMNDKSIDADSIFYIRTVNSNDTQGIWGIIQRGLIENFARGIALRRGENINTYQVDIPADADEVRQDRSSSYLGRILDAKVRESWVYNYALGKMGRNPGLIHPGQEIIIIHFSTDELVDIYKHFVQTKHTQA